MATDAQFQQALDVVLGYEGGYVNNPNDPGGATNKGITQKVYQQWLGDANADVANITDDEVAAIYHDNYWVPSGAADLPWPMALAVFDTAVNMGVGEAQTILSRNPTDSVAYLADRKNVYAQIAANRPASAGFLNGWLARVDDLASLMKGGGGIAVGVILAVGLGLWYLVASRR